MRKFLASLVAFILVFGTAVSVCAQTQARVDLYPPDASTFPTISTLVDVYDANGIFASGLKPEAVTVLENGQAIPADSFNEQAIPLQIVVAVNQGPALDARDGTGLSRFQRVSQVLAGWAQTRPADLPDDFSLVSQAGQEMTHGSAADFMASLGSFNPDFRAATPNLQSLAIAIDIASQQTPRAGMKRAVLFITPHMDDPNIATAIEPFIQLARERTVRIFIWFVDTSTYFPTTSAAAFNTLAMQSGGSMYGFSGLEPLPDPEEYFSGLRRVYVLTYQSRVVGSGEQKLSVQVALAVGSVSSGEQIFNMDIQPPNPIFVNPPMQITRRAPEDDPFNAEVLEPEVQAIEIIIEFPDHHVRELVRTTLYVDGQIMDENASEPFDQFTWDLSSYQLSGEHQLIVEAVDTLGMNKTSIAIPVAMTVVQPPRGAAAMLARYRQEITIGAIACAGLALLAILLSGRVKFPSLRARREAKKAYHDPVTQPVQVPAPPVAVAAEKDKTGRNKNGKKPAPRVRLVEAPASFIRLGPDGQPASSNPIAVASKEMTFGLDPVQVTYVLEDASVAPLHARLRQTDDGGYLLLDNNSIAGTWVNYEPVPREGYRLTHGDVVHFGKLMYRFALRAVPTPQKPRVTVQNIAE
ncbi:MAG: FHA domain-containing protein [Chloroflexota bacterium]